MVRNAYDTASLWSDDPDVRPTGSPIEPDSADDGQSIMSTQSLRQSLIELYPENGRLYTLNGSYLLPSDDIESERLNTQYIILQSLFNGVVHFAPLSRKPRSVFDAGTGTGDWCFDMQRLYPDAQIYGADIAMIQRPTPHTNIHWIRMDVQKEDWGMKFDYVHTRMLLGCFDNYMDVVQRGFDSLQPGGWMESQEMWTRAHCDDGTLDTKTGIRPDGTKDAFWQWTEDQDLAAMNLQRPVRVANKLKRYYKKVGFLDVREEIFRIPICGWPKDPRLKMLGRFWGKALTDGLNAFSMAMFTRAFQWEPEQVEVMLVDVRKAIRDRSVHAYHTVHVVYGRKPTRQEQILIDQQKAAEAARNQPSANGTGFNPSAAAYNHTYEPGSSSSSGGAHQANGAGASGYANHQNGNRRPKQPFSATPHANLRK